MIAIIAILAAMLMPALERARESARRGVCLSNLRQQQMASQLYVNGSEGMRWAHEEGGNVIYVDGAARWRPNWDEHAQVGVRWWPATGTVSYGTDALMEHLGGQ